MASFKVHTFLVRPAKNIDPQPSLSGKEVTSSGGLVDLLAKIFHSPPDQRDFEVTFRKSSSGAQQNDCRDLVVNYQASATIGNARSLAERLQRVTDKRSGMGLLFVMSGQHGTKYRTVLSRFPANEGIFAEINDGGLDVAFLEQVFIRQLSAYKALVLEDNDPKNQYWSGFATDRQAGGTPENISGYWLNDFLTADFSDSPKAGTLRLADALRKAVGATPNLSVKEEIASAVSLAPKALGGKATSIDQFFQHFGLSNDARDTIRAQLKKPSLASKAFTFDANEFRKRVPYRSVQLVNGAILKAPSSEFNKVFDVAKIDGNKMRYTTEGKVADQKMTKR